MVRVSDEDVAYRTFRALELGRYLYYLQEYIPHANQDIRAFVVGGKIVAAMLRRGRNWKTNLTRGGQGEALVLEEETEELAVRAAQVFRADYLGVDILRSLDGCSYVVEVNSIPGWEGLQKTTEVDIAGAIVDHVLETL
jgi:ribosomal protein S6--L-glutamate ligase/tetrahydromethanopterin:alpha-L-glutamate ligase